MYSIQMRYGSYTCVYVSVPPLLSAFKFAFSLYTCDVFDFVLKDCSKNNYAISHHREQSILYLLDSMCVLLCTNEHMRKVMVGKLLEQYQVIITIVFHIVH